MPPNAAELLQAHAALHPTGTTVTQVDGKKYIEQTGACIESNSVGYVVDHKPDPEICAVINGSLYIGSQDAAVNVDGYLSPCGEKVSGLRELCISHVVNACDGHGQVPGIHYLHLPLLDLPEQRLEDAAERSSAFIRSAVDSGGRCLVHCNAGISRSTSLVIAYLLSRGLAADYDSALKAVRKHRPSAKPNQGFEAQLRAMAAKDVALKSESCTRVSGVACPSRPQKIAAPVPIWTFRLARQSFWIILARLSASRPALLLHGGTACVSESRVGGPSICGMNADGTLARIANWESMSDRDRELTRRRTAEHNLERLAHLQGNSRLDEQLVSAVRPG